jgi:hypothetical protein
MFPRRKNLLEAFKSSSVQNTPSASAPRETAAPSRATLFESTGAGRAVGPRFAPPLALVLIALVLAFVAGYAVGHSRRGEASAKESAPAPARPVPPAYQPRAFQEPPAAKPSAADAPAPSEKGAAGPRIEDTALWEPANLQTVVVASYYKSNASSSDYAWATYQHLKDANLPVFPPVESRNLVVVLAGAARTEGELQELKRAVQALSRDGKKKDYADAYCARIDTLIPRPKKGTENP